MENYKRYNEISRLVAELTKEKKELSGKLLSDMTEKDVNQIETDYGTFYVSARKKITYPKEIEAQVKEKKNEIDAIYEKAMEDNKAEIEEVKSIGMRAKK